MGRAYSNDLRVRILEADERGEGSCRVLAKRFGVSWEYVRKLRRQQTLTGQKARVAQSRYGIQSKVSEPVKTHPLRLVKSQPDLRLGELRERIRLDKGVSMSWGLVHLWVRRLGLRLKKVAPRRRTRHRSQPHPPCRVPPAHPRDPSEKARLAGRKRHLDHDDTALCALPRRSTHP